MALLIGPLSGACRTHERFDDPPSELVVSSKPLAVTLSNEVRNLSTRVELAGTKIRFRTGNLLGHLFSSGDGRSFLSLVDSKLEIDWKAQGWRSEYLLVLALQNEGSYHLIQCTGTGESTESPKGSGRVAIEQCIERIYARVSELVRR